MMVATGIVSGQLIVFILFFPPTCLLLKIHHRHENRCLLLYVRSCVAKLRATKTRDTLDWRQTLTMWTPKVAGAYYAALCFFFGGRVIGGVADPSLLPLRPGFGSSPRAVDSPGGGVIQKTAFSNNTRMIFIAGLEGSGHHFVNNVFQAVCESRSVECPDVCAIADIWFSTLAEFNSTSEYEKGRERLRSEMGTLALTAERLRTEGSSDASVATFHHCGNEVGEMSYPNWDGNDKPLQYVDLRILAEEAEGAGIDLRVIYLSRPAEEIMISTTEHRDFGR